MASNLAIALLHYPVYNKHQEVVTTALTNLDVHDIARSAKTFGLDRFYIVTPSAEQRNLAQRITGHWQEGWGASYNPDRRDALEIIRICDNLDSAISDWQVGFDTPVKTVITGATEWPGSLAVCEFKQMLDKHDDPFLLLFGTGWGLTKETFEAAGHILKPIAGPDSYNHLSVRSAAAIMLDRLRGK
ncbi:MAG TPA: RNA methyltransferase [Desulfuromonadaceae bacterium]